ncbi:efflux RND transporter permease subunit [Escherichia coli]
MTDFGGKTSIFSHPVYLFLRKFSLQDFRGGSLPPKEATEKSMSQIQGALVGIAMVLSAVFIPMGILRRFYWGNLSPVLYHHRFGNGAFCSGGIDSYPCVMCNTAQTHLS